MFFDPALSSTQLEFGWHVHATMHVQKKDVLTQHAIYYQLYGNNKMLQGLRPGRGMLKKVLFAASKFYQENNQSHPTR